MEGPNLSREFMTLHNYEKNLSKGEDMFLSANHYDNQAKNRYFNILPNEQTRVRLQPLPDVPGSDYINANLIRGIEIDAALEHQDYIATQAPIEDVTFDDFWRMVWEQKVPLIVMLTGCKERGMVKADCYWPKVGCLAAFGADIFVENVEEHKNKLCTDVVERRFVVRRADHPPLTVTHLQYTGWPDHGVPKSSQSIKQLVELSGVCSSTSPMLVHCSAGVGRSGTFITIHSAITLFRKRMQLSNETTQSKQGDHSVPAFNIFNIVKALKTARIGMVQQYEQYMFCYSTLEEMLYDLESAGQISSESTDVTIEENKD